MTKKFGNKGVRKIGFRKNWFRKFLVSEFFSFGKTAFGKMDSEKCPGTANLMEPCFVILHVLCAP